MNSISNLARIGRNVIMEDNIWIGDHAEIGDNCFIGRNSIINNVVIGNNSKIEANCIIGYANVTGWVSRETPAEALKFERLVIGEACLIREGCTLYVGSKLGSKVKVHHKTLIRENCVIGNNTSIGSFCDLEGHLFIGNDCSIHSNCHICYDTRIGDYVFMAPFCVTTNGNPMSYKRPALYEIHGFEKGPRIDSGCQIAVHVTILPRVHVGHECLIGANSVVTKDTAPLSILVGTPAQIKGKVEGLHRLPAEIRKQIGIND